MFSLYTNNCLELCPAFNTTKLPSTTTMPSTTMTSTQTTSLSTTIATTTATTTATATATTTAKTRANQPTRVVKWTELSPFYINLKAEKEI